VKVMNSIKYRPNSVLRLFMILATLIMIYPLFWNVYSSLKTNTEFLANPFTLPKTFAWDNYVRAFTKSNIGDNLFNSVYVVVIALIVIVICAIPSAYCLSRFRFFGS
jgi:N-acetylglucosamine transport system permease protein